MFGALATRLLGGHTPKDKGARARFILCDCVAMLLDQFIPTPIDPHPTAGRRLCVRSTDSAMGRCGDGAGWDCRCAWHRYFVHFIKRKKVCRLVE